jgi:hypothetical protein
MEKVADENSGTFDLVFRDKEKPFNNIDTRLDKEASALLELMPMTAQLDSGINLIIFFSSLMPRNI